MHRWVGGVLGSGPCGPVCSLQETVLMAIKDDRGDAGHQLVMSLCSPGHGQSATGSRSRGTGDVEHRMGGDPE